MSTLLAPSEISDDPQTLHLHDLDFSDIFIGERIFEIKNPGSRYNPVPLNTRLEDSERIRAALYAACQDQFATRHTPEFAISHDGIRFRAAVLQSRDEDTLFVLRRLPDAVPALSSLGLSDWILKRLARPRLSGMILMAGSTGSGKTTTISSLILNRLQRDSGVCLTIEDPPEMPLEGLHGNGRCYQIEVHDGDFATPCRQSLRMNPDYLFLGEIRDAHSALESLRAALSGHLVYATIHAYSVGGAVERLHSMVSSLVGSDDAASMVAAALSGAIHQKLVRNGDQRYVDASLLWTVGPDMTAVRTQIARKQFNMLDSEVNAQKMKAEAGTLS